MARGEFVVAEAQPFDGAGREVVQEDIGGGEQAGETFGAGFDIDRDAALAAIEPGEVGETCCRRAES